jgi:hypothetical protein
MRGELPISLHGACPRGSTRTDPSWYGNAALFCAPATIHPSNGVALLRLP